MKRSELRILGRSRPKVHKTTERQRVGRVPRSRYFPGGRLLFGVTIVSVPNKIRKRLTGAKR